MLQATTFNWSDMMAARFFLPDSPEKARFLNEDEKEVAKARAISQVSI
jgi:hypothetical protein